MTPDHKQSQALANQVYQYAADQMLYGNKNSYEVKVDLMQKGLSEDDADSIVADIEQQVNAAKKKSAQKDMLYGALWCLGGLALTFAHIGFIFWGAIIFGAIQFFKGASKMV